MFERIAGAVASRMVPWSQAESDVYEESDMNMDMLSPGEESERSEVRLSLLAHFEEQQRDINISDRDGYRAHGNAR